MKVLIHGGAGGIGGTAVQLARHLGAHVTTTCSSASTSYALENGAHRVIAYDREDFSAQLRDLDVVVDTIGGEVHARSYATLRRGGCLVYLLAKPIQNRGTEFDVAVRQALVFREVGQLDAACQLFAEGALVARLRKVLPLEAAAAAHSEIETGHGHGKLVLQLAA
jgi:NADPH:quinone reductase-like Zn-dependent oxidoreductase